MNPARRLSTVGYVLLLSAGVLALPLAFGLSLAFGAVAIPPAEIWLRLFDPLGGPESTILFELRLPRTLQSGLVGGTLSVVGAMLQAVMRSPLADPYVLGVSSGAMVGATLGVLLGLSSLGSTGLAFLTGLFSVVSVFTLARVGGRVSPLRLLLSGVAFSSFAGAVSTFLLYLVPEATSVRALVFWLFGGFQTVDWTEVQVFAALAAPGLFAALFLSHGQNLLLLGDEAAESLGLDVTRARALLVLLAAFLTAGAVAAGGAIGFVGLAVPHLFRGMTGPDHRRLLPVCFLYGALLLIAMDTLARSLLPPSELPVGVLTGLFGAPFFLAVLRRQRGSEHAF